MAIFDGSLDVFNEVVSRYSNAHVLEELSPHDDMVNLSDPNGMSNYLRVGRNAIELILSSMITTKCQGVKSILDMPSGFGRVTRHIAAAFPDAALTVCDLYEDRIAYCAETFGARPVMSTENLDDLTFPEPFDVIWCGSLLTHLPEQSFLNALRLFSRSLTQDGIAVITTHGRFSPWYSHERSKYLANDAFLAAERGFYRDGFGYAEYPNLVEYSTQDTYGISLSSMAFIGQALETDMSIRVVSFIERGWDGHQDVLVFRKSPIYN